MDGMTRQVEVGDILIPTNDARTEAPNPYMGAMFLADWDCGLPPPGGTYCAAAFMYDVTSDAAIRSSGIYY